MSEADRCREGGAAKRRKTNDDDDKEGLLRIIEELTARVEELEVRVDELESENKGLRGEENHDDSLLPVVATASVDLSRVDPSLVAQIASFVGLSRELLSMALTCKSFGWRWPSSTLGLSLVEEAARQFVTIQLRPSDVERNALPPFGGTTAWLPILHELEQLRLPLKFSKLVCSGIEYAGSESIVTSSYDYFCTAVTSYVMKRGVHYASFKLINGNAIVGVARPFRNFDFANEEEGFDMFDYKHFGHLLAQRTDAWIGNVHYCHIECRAGVSIDAEWTDFLEYKDEIDWEGRERFDEGDTAGLFVDLNEGSLSVYRNGRRLGVVKDGLAGEYCFFGTLYEDVELSIERGTPP